MSTARYSPFAVIIILTSIIIHRFTSASFAGNTFCARASSHSQIGRPATCATAWRLLSSATGDISTGGGASNNSNTPDNDETDADLDEQSSGEVKSKSRRGGRNKNKNRFRQHVNPLARKFQAPALLSETNFLPDAFQDPTKDLHLDVGCGKGGFILKVAEADESYEKNYLGLEIRPSVVDFARDRAKRHEMDGIVHYVSCNANVDLERILGQYTGKIKRENGDHPTIASVGGKISLVSIQFPDPHFKKSHEKRRVVNPLFVDTLAKHMETGSQIFLQSDVKPVLDYMRETFRASPYYKDDLESVEEYLCENPLGFPTEREISVQNRNLSVW
eukprot:CAMPEP_0196818118 /NCGR_PEP_ID=MMETSP1362-20130617/64062_1 /TAXON_ID=163516 /ORGANISM="Leptocylindrus danicus, Strain CCMP1856" /LENGTH=331 /DNA_ID=CAMNT_0042196069 /DNA_START=112 /DNA_END=1104 /DNA_ORIENTATION=-